MQLIMQCLSLVLYLCAIKGLQYMDVGCRAAYITVSAQAGCYGYKGLQCMAVGQSISLCLLYSLVVSAQADSYDSCPVLYTLSTFLAPVQNSLPLC